MLDAVVSVAVIAVLVAAAIVVHELGHYAAAAVAGIPAAERRIVFLAAPPHVALADGDEWVSPFENARFSELYGRFDPTREYGVLFTGGGFLGQVFGVVPVGLAVGALYTSVGVSIVASSLGFAVVYLGIDIVATARRGSPFGDTTHLWRLDRPQAVALVALLFGSHLLALAWLL